MAEVIAAHDGVAMTAEQVIRITAERTDAQAKTLTEKVLGGDRVIKTIMPKEGAAEERFVLGIVLEPEEVDAQKDIYSAEEVRSAAHKFMEQYQNIGLMHSSVVNEQVKILESYVAPVSFEMDDTEVREGTWLLAVRVLDDDLWEAVKEGGLTGFSIGGSAIRVPERPTLD
jgi:DNA adenine methylase